MRNVIKQILKEEFDSKSDRVKSIVNRYGIDKSIEMVAGGIDTIKQAYINNPSSYLDQFNNLTKVDMDNKIFYVDKDGLPFFYFIKNKKNKDVYINNNKIWSFFRKIIGLKRSEISSIIINWLEDKYNITGLLPTEDYKF